MDRQHFFRAFEIFKQRKENFGVTCKNAITKLYRKRKQADAIRKLGQYSLPGARAGGAHKEPTAAARLRLPSRVGAARLCAFYQFTHIRF